MRPVGVVFEVARIRRVSADVESGKTIAVHDFGEVAVPLPTDGGRIYRVKPHVIPAIDPDDPTQMAVRTKKKSASNPALERPRFLQRPDHHAPEPHVVVDLLESNECPTDVRRDRSLDFGDSIVDRHEPYPVGRGIDVPTQDGADPTTIFTSLDHTDLTMVDIHPHMPRLRNDLSHFVVCSGSVW